jgi:hypothetical protein
MKRSLITFLTILSLTNTFAAEVDSYTRRNTGAADASEKLNEFINERIAKGIKVANSEDFDDGITCDEKNLYRELRRAIYDSFTANLGLKGYALDKQIREHLNEYIIHTPLDESIYRDLSYFEAFSTNLKELADTFQVNNHIIGTDKIGHFFSEGFSYFDMVNKDDTTLFEAMEWGEKKEEGIFGEATTGVYSYADLMANFHGLRFWNRVLLKKPDPIANWFKKEFDEQFDTAYIKCDLKSNNSDNIKFIFDFDFDADNDNLVEILLDKQWYSIKKFDINEYVDGTWDEAINCNEYRNENIEEKVNAEVSSLFPAPQRTCPLIPAQCESTYDKYGVYSDYLLFPTCNQ